MTDDPCRYEAEVLRAAESGHWTPDLEAHAASCDDCRDVRAVALSLQDVVRAEDATPLPGAGDIWWRARWLAEREARQRAMRPLAALERSEPLVALVALVTLVVLRGEAIGARLLEWLTGDAGAQTLQVLVAPAVMPLVLAGMALGGLVLLVGLGAVLAND